MQEQLKLHSHKATIDKRLQAQLVVISSEITSRPVQLSSTLTFMMFTMAIRIAFPFSKL